MARRIGGKTVGKGGRHAAAAEAAHPGVPTKEEILAFVAQNPGEAGKREIARHFGITGAGRIHLKRILKELEGEGTVARGRGRRFETPGQMPSVTVVAITHRDQDGELIGQPIDWDDDFGPAPTVLILLESNRKKTLGPAPGVGDRALIRLVDDDGRAEGHATHAARVIKVLERKPAAALGILRIGPALARVVPVDKKGKEYTLALEDIGDAQDGDLVSLDIVRAGRMGLQRAKVRETIGSMASEKAVSEIALHVHGIPHVFPSAVLAEAERAKPVTLKDREDWRDLPLVSIDPPDAKDHDDAVHGQPDPDPANPGGHVVTVAIADVAAYVTPGSAMDREALLRGNSVYFPDRVVPMLPERISNDLCSLKGGVDRPALAVRMVFAADGRKKSHTFHRILMRSAAKLAYAQAQAAIDGRVDETTDPILNGVLKPLWEAYACLKRGRDAREPLDLDLPERKILLKPDGTVDRVIVPERLDAHKLIEEMMIQANVCAAETLEKHKVPLVYRIHDAPSLEKLESLREFLGSLDISLPKAGALRPSQFNHILARVVDTPNQTMVNEVVLRSQAQAEYHPLNIGHFGLNLRRYAHFTSPIRRYADLIVHRALIRALRLGPDGLPEAIDDKLEAIGSEISAAERRAMAAERDTIDRLIARHLADRIGSTFNGKIGGVTKSGLFIKLDDTGADGFIPISTLGDDYFVHDEARHALVGSRTGETFRLGDRVEVRLVEAAPFAGALRFEMLSAGTRGRLPPRGGAARIQKRGGPPKGIKRGRR